MEPTSLRIKRLFLLTLFLLTAYLFCRLFFILLNQSELGIHSFRTFLEVLVGGLRFDLSAIAMSNALFFFLAAFPAPFTLNRRYQKVTSVLFFSINGLCLMLNLIDVAYFPFIHKRSQNDLLQFFDGEKGNDIWKLIPTFLKDYWYLALIFILFLWAMILFYRYSARKLEETTYSHKKLLHAFLAFVLVLGLNVLAIRGGIQARPLNLIHASEMTEVNNIPAIINTPFSIFKSLGTKHLKDLKYYPDNQLADLPAGIQNQPSALPFNKKNVVIIVVESLSKRHISFFGGSANTPFLDSLFNESLVFNNSFANAKQSILGIPAVISSIPSWQSEPFIFSPYAGNKITSLAGVLGKQGYQSTFYHGGFNGTMGFDSYASLAEYDHYYGSNEYNNNADFDCWGIWDEPFLQRVADLMEQTKQPFFSSIFTLNTHHPFKIPEKYKNRFNKHDEPLLNCVEYADYSLSKFFEKAKSKPWFDNTLFVITADHTASYLNGEKMSSFEDYRIPIVFYQHNNTELKGRSNVIANQIDILPSVLDQLHYPQPFFSFGSSLFRDVKDRCAITYMAEVYQYIDDNNCYLFNGEKPIAFYNWKSDSLLTNNLYSGNWNAQMAHCDSALKKRIQFFNQSMLHNKMHLLTSQ